MSTDTAAALAEPAARQRLGQLGYEVIGSTPEQLGSICARKSTSGARSSRALESASNEASDVVLSSAEPEGSLNRRTSGSPTNKTESLMITRRRLIAASAVSAVAPRFAAPGERASAGVAHPFRQACRTVPAGRRHRRAWPHGRRAAVREVGPAGRGGEQAAAPAATSPPNSSPVRRLTATPCTSRRPEWR